MPDRRRGLFVGAVALTVAVTVTVTAQETPPADLRFEAASIRPAAPGGPPISGTTIQAHRLRGTKVSLLALIRSVYFAEGLTASGQFTGGPEWIATERWDIDAVAATVSTRTQFNRMLRNLLTDRFKLRVRRELREQPVFALVLARGDRRLGPALSGVTVDCTAYKDAFERVQLPRPEPGAPLQPKTCDTLVSSGPDGVRIAGRAVELPELARMLTSYFDAPVIDRTGLSGRYDFDLTFVRDLNAPSADGAPLTTALREQLGLRGERQRAPMDTLVIESAERPASN